MDLDRSIEDLSLSLEWRRTSSHARFRELISRPQFTWFADIRRPQRRAL